MAFIKVTADDLSQLATQLTSTSSNIHAESETARAQVQHVVGEGWEGAASEQFNQLFEQWNTSAKGLIDALTGVSELLRQAGGTYAETEAQVTRSFGS